MNSTDKLHYHLRKDTKHKSPVSIQATGCSAYILIVLAFIGLGATIHYVICHL